MRRFIAISLLCLSFAHAALAEPKILTAPAAAKLLADNQLVVLDIRRPQEWAESGIAKGAWPVSMHTADFAQKLGAILGQYEPDQVALICATGGRTAYVTDILEKNGYTGVADVSEGMFGNGTGSGWIARGLPVITADEARTSYEAARKSWE